MVSQTDKEKEPRSWHSVVWRIAQNSIIAFLLLVVLYGVWTLEKKRIDKQYEVIDRLLTIVEFEAK